MREIQRRILTEMILRTLKTAGWTPACIIYIQLFKNFVLVLFCFERTLMCVWPRISRLYWTLCSTMCDVCSNAALIHQEGLGSFFNALSLFSQCDVRLSLPACKSFASVSFWSVEPVNVFKCWAWFKIDLLLVFGFFCFIFIFCSVEMTDLTIYEHSITLRSSLVAFEICFESLSICTIKKHLVIISPFDWTATTAQHTIHTLLINKQPRALSHFMT